MTEYRVDDLARAAGTTVRNVRVYQDRGLLPPPRREGRVGVYTEQHLARLTLIGRLLERGYTFATIRELLDAWSAGRDLSDVLGLSDAITQPYTDEVAGHITPAELRRRFGPGFTRREVNRAVELGLLERSGSAFRVPSPRLLAAGAELATAGVPVSAVLDLAEQLRADLATVAGRFVSIVAARLVAEQAGEDGLPTPERIGEIVELIRRLRPHARQAVDAMLAAAMSGESQRVFDELAARAARRPTASSA